MERIDDEGVETFVKEITEQVVRVVSEASSPTFILEKSEEIERILAKDHQSHPGYSEW